MGVVAPDAALGGGIKDAFGVVVGIAARSGEFAGLGAGGGDIDEGAEGTFESTFRPVVDVPSLTEGFLTGIDELHVFSGVIGPAIPRYAGARRRNRLSLYPGVERGARYGAPQPV